MVRSQTDNSFAASRFDTSSDDSAGIAGVSFEYEAIGFSMELAA